MSIIDAVLGNAYQADAKKVQKEHEEIFIISLQRTLAYYLFN